VRDKIRLKQNLINTKLNLAKGVVDTKVNLVSNLVNTKTAAIGGLFSGLKAQGSGQTKPSYNAPVSYQPPKPSYGPPSYY